MTITEGMEIIRKIRYKYTIIPVYLTEDKIGIGFRVKPSPGTEHQLMVGSDGLTLVCNVKAANISALNELEFLAVVYDLFAEFEVHECSEFFEYNGIKVFNSHDLTAKNGAFTQNIVAPRIKDIDLHYIENHVRLKKEAEAGWNKVYDRIFELERMNVWERIKFLFTGRIWRV